MARTCARQTPVPFFHMPPLASNVVELTQALVRIPSVNPDGDPGTGCIGEQQCALYVADFLRAAGAEVTLEEVEPARPNVIGRFPTHPSANGTPKPRILFAPHTDTVSVGGMTIPPFGGELRDGKVWGRGASDTKGPMASMLWALHEMGMKSHRCRSKYTLSASCPRRAHSLAHNTLPNTTGATISRSSVSRPV